MFLNDFILRDVKIQGYVVKGEARIATDVYLPGSFSGTPVPQISDQSQPLLLGCRV